MLNLYCWARSRFYSLRNEKGATAVEYGIMVALIAIAIIATVFAVGQGLDGLFQTVEEALDGTPGAPVVP